jgi:hypothetical protein
MKAIEVNMDGIKYYVKIEAERVLLFVNTMRSEPIYSEGHYYLNTNLYTLRDAKKFILRSFEKV